MDTLFTRKRCDKESTAVVLMCREELGERTRTRKRDSHERTRRRPGEPGGKEEECGWRMDGRDGKKKRRDSNVNHHDVSSLIC